MTGGRAKGPGGKGTGSGRKSLPGRQDLSGRGLKTRVKTGRGRSTSSLRWLERQLNDSYVAEARKLGYRSRAAFKLRQLDDKFGFLRPGASVVDLGAAPGGWAQVAVERCGKQARIIGIDLVEVAPIEGVTLLTGDFLEPEALTRIEELLDGRQVDVVLSDMAAPATGHTQTDHLRIMGLAEAAADFAEAVLAPGGTFVAKVLQGGTESSLLARLKKNFTKLRHVKPAASRSDSAELYLVASGFRGEKRLTD